MPVSWQRLAFMTGRLMCHISTYHPNNQIFVKWSILTIFSFQFSQVFSVGAILDVLFCCMSKKEPHFYKNVTGNEWFHMWKWQFYMWIWLFWKWKENEWSKRSPSCVWFFFSLSTSVRYTGFFHFHKKFASSFLNCTFSHIFKCKWLFPRANYNFNMWK